MKPNNEEPDKIKALSRRYFPHDSEKRAELEDALVALRASRGQGARDDWKRFRLGALIALLAAAVVGIIVYLALEWGPF